MIGQRASGDAQLNSADRRWRLQWFDTVQRCDEHDDIRWFHSFTHYQPTGRHRRDISCRAPLTSPIVATTVLSSKASMFLYANNNEWSKEGVNMDGQIRRKKPCNVFIARAKNVCSWIQNSVTTTKVQGSSVFQSLFTYSFYRAMHFSAKRGIAIACRLSVRLSVCLWRWWIVIT